MNLLKKIDAEFGKHALTNNEMGSVRGGNWLNTRRENVDGEREFDPESFARFLSKQNADDLPPELCVESMSFHEIRILKKAIRRGEDLTPFFNMTEGSEE